MALSGVYSALKRSRDGPFRASLPITMNSFPIFRLSPNSPNEAIPLDLSDFWRISPAPQEIFVQCKKEALPLLSLLPERGLAIVGTRNPQAKTVAYVQKFVHHLKDSGLIIVSGLARGIDGIAHWSALQAQLPTVAILGAGLDQPYPKENTVLREKILGAGGILITEYPPGTPPRGYQFLERNRLIAGWSKATWVAEAGLRSGALSTAKWAREQNRITFALPCFPGDGFLGGNQTLLDRDHALAIWGTHSLGAAWLELATSNIPSRNPPQSPTEPLNRLALLTEQIERLTYEKGGVTPGDLMSWAYKNGWNPSDFFLTLQKAKSQEAVQEQLGVLVRIPFSGGPTHVS